MEVQVEDHPDPLDVELLEAHIRSEASSVKGLGDEVELAIFVRDAGTIVAGISGWTWGDCCELQSLWVAPHLRGRGLAPRLLAAAALDVEPDALRPAKGGWSADDGSDPAKLKTIEDIALYAHGTGALPPGVEGGLDAQTVYSE